VNRADELIQVYNMNFTLLDTPVEGICHRFAKFDEAQFGNISRITCNDYYTNSFHIQVNYHIGVMKKNDLEAPYHIYYKAGHITYIELDGDTSQNVEAIVCHMK
jgi:ribonucleoside-triphosphate reductase